MKKLNTPPPTKPRYKKEGGDPVRSGTNVSPGRVSKAAGGGEGGSKVKKGRWTANGFRVMGKREKVEDEDEEDEEDEQDEEDY